MVELDGADAGRSAYLSDLAGESLSIGEGLALVANGVDDESYFCRANSIIGNGVIFKRRGALVERNCESVLG